MIDTTPDKGSLVQGGLRFLLSSVPKAIIGTLILASIALNFANAAGRYVFLEPIIWAEEIMIYIMMWITFAGAVLVTWRNRHLSMDIFVLLLPTRWRHAVNWLVVVGFVVVLGIVLVHSWQVLAVYFRTWPRSNVAEIPMVIPHAAVLFGVFLMLVAVLVRLRMYILGEYEAESGEVVGGFTAVPHEPKRADTTDEAGV